MTLWSSLAVNLYIISDILSFGFVLCFLVQLLNNVVVFLVLSG